MNLIAPVVPKQEGPLISIRSTPLREALIEKGIGGWRAHLSARDFVLHKVVDWGQFVNLDLAPQFIAD